MLPRQSVKFVVVLSMCYSAVVSQALMTSLDRHAQLRDRVFIISSGGQWPGTATVPLIHTVMQHVSGTDGTQEVLKRRAQECMQHECLGASAHNLVSSQHEWMQLLQFHPV